MEAVRHPLGQGHLGDVAAVEVLGVDHRQLGGAVGDVVDEGHQPAVVLVGGALTADEHRLAGAATGAVVERPALAGAQVVLVGRPLRRLVGGAGGVAVAVRLGGQRTAAGGGTPAASSRSRRCSPGGWSG